MYRIMIKISGNPITSGIPAEESHLTYKNTFILVRDIRKPRSWKAKDTNATVLTREDGKG